MSLWNHSAFANVESVYIIEKVMQNNWFELGASLLKFLIWENFKHPHKRINIYVINSHMLVTHIQQRINILLSLFHFFHTHSIFFFLSFFLDHAASGILVPQQPPQWTSREVPFFFLLEHLKTNDKHHVISL